MLPGGGFPSELEPKCETMGLPGGWGAWGAWVTLGARAEPTRRPQTDARTPARLPPPTCSQAV